MTDMLFDDFVGPAGSPIDPAVWTHEPRNSWASEVQSYVPEAVSLDGYGSMRITASRDADGVITSGRVSTAGKLTIPAPRTNGDRTRVEVKANLKGLTHPSCFPAIWLRGAIDPWPRTGELDIMESTGSIEYLMSTVHMAGASGSDWSVSNRLNTTPEFKQRSHVFGLTWDPGWVRFDVDGVVVKTAYRFETQKASADWPFDKAQGDAKLVINLAVGGMAPQPDPAQPFPPQSMYVDSVRIWRGGVPA